MISTKNQNILGFVWKLLCLGLKWIFKPQTCIHVYIEQVLRGFEIAISVPGFEPY